MVREKISTHLQPIYDLELSLGNSVVQIEEPAGSTCPLAIIFKNPLHRAEIESKVRIPPSVHWLESRDEHYSRDGEGAYKCDETGHAMIGQTFAGIYCTAIASPLTSSSLTCASGMNIYFSISYFVFCSFCPLIVRNLKKIKILPLGS